MERYTSATEAAQIALENEGKETQVVFNLIVQQATDGNKFFRVPWKLSIETILALKHHGYRVIVGEVSTKIEWGEKPFKLSLTGIEQVLVFLTILGWGLFFICLFILIKN